MQKFFTKFFFYIQEEARRSNKVSSLVNVDDFEVTQRVGHVAFSHRGKIWVSDESKGLHT